MRLLDFGRKSQYELDDSQIPEVRAPPCLDRGGSWQRLRSYPDLLSCFAGSVNCVCEDWLKIFLVDCHVNTSDSPFLDETIEEKSA